MRTVALLVAVMLVVQIITLAWVVMGDAEILRTLKDKRKRRGWPYE